MVEFVEIGFWLVTALAAVLFFQTLLGYRKYRLLKAEYERLLHQHAKETSTAEHVVAKLWERIQLIEKQAEGITQEISGATELPKQVSSSLEGLKRRQQELEEFIVEMRSELERKKTPEEFADLEAKLKKSLEKLEKKVQAQTKKEITLGKKVTLLRKLENEVKKSKRRLSEVLQDHGRLKFEFEKHEVTPIHVEAGSVEDVQDEIERLAKAVKNIDGQLKVLRRMQDDAEEKLAQHTSSIKIVEGKVL